MRSIEIRERPGRVALLCLLSLGGAGLFYYVYGYLPLPLRVAAGAVVVAVPFRLAWGFDTGPCIVLDEEGVNDKRLKAGVIRWEDIRRPYVLTLFGAEYVCLELRDAAAYRARMPAWQRLAGALNGSLGMTPFAISTSCLDVDAEALVAYIHRGCEKAHAL